MLSLPKHLYRFVAQLLNVMQSAAKHLYLITN